MEQKAGNGLLWPDGPPREAWRTFDATPWLHPWLTRANLQAMRQASAAWREEARRVLEQADRFPNHFAFVGNMANNMYTRAKALARTGAQVELFGVYGDDFIMSDARWEEYDGFLPEGASFVGDDRSFLDHVKTAFPFSRFDATGKWATMHECDLPAHAREADFRRWPGYFCHLPAFEQLQAFDAVLATQTPFIAYLSGKPYAATPTGGDIWLEASRDDALGRLQRASFEHAGCILVSNPWTFAHARRYGMANLIYLPMILDERDYAPGPPELRKQWEAESGGNFFALSTARADNYYKGPQIGLRGFAEFARSFPGARLVVTTWGKDIGGVKNTAAQLGIGDRLLFAPAAGKRMVVKYLRSADCLLDQFVLGYYGGTGIEGAACGLPVIMRFEQAQYDALLDSGAPPFLNAATSTEVANALQFLAADAERRRGLSNKHRDWFLKSHSGERWADEYLATLGAVALEHKFSFAASPLAVELSPVERLYHAEELASAPEFPNYEKPTASQAETLFRDQVTRLTADVRKRFEQIDRQISDISMQTQQVEKYSSELRSGLSFIIDPARTVTGWIVRGLAVATHFSSRLRDMVRRAAHAAIRLDHS
jgi:glycosyltransferase involved in cell wall biosynthesis